MSTARRHSTNTNVTGRLVASSCCNRCRSLVTCHVTDRDLAPLSFQTKYVLRAPVHPRQQLPHPQQVLNPLTARCVDPHTLGIYSVVADKFFPRKVKAANATLGGCYQAFVPSRWLCDLSVHRIGTSFRSWPGQKCSNYDRCGFHCVGSFCSMDCDNCE